jgi:hypothetical protein
MEVTDNKAHNAKVKKLSRRIAEKIAEAVKPQRSKAEKTMALEECQQYVTEVSELATRLREAGRPMALAKELQEALHEWLLVYPGEANIFAENFPTVFEFEDPYEQKIYVRGYRQEDAYKTRDLKALEILRNQQLAELKGCMANLIASLDGIAEYTSKAAAYQQLVAEIEAPARGRDPPHASKAPKTAAPSPAKKIVKKVAKVEDKSAEPGTDSDLSDVADSQPKKVAKPPAKVVKKATKPRKIVKKVAKVEDKKKAAKIAKAKVEDKSEETESSSDVGELGLVCWSDQE